MIKVPILGRKAIEIFNNFWKRKSLEQVESIDTWIDIGLPPTNLTNFFDSSASGMQKYASFRSNLHMKSPYLRICLNDSSLSILKW